VSGLVLQSHRRPLPFAWLERCLDSVATWARAQGLERRFVDDELFDLVPADLMAKCAERRVVATDLARLAWLDRALEQGYEPVVWIEADVLVFDPDGLQVGDTSCAVGRETWVEGTARAPRVRRHVQNAWLMFRRSNPLLAFYRYTAERMVRVHEGPMVPQLIGPKLLTALHNLAGFPVREAVDMLSPAVLGDVARGGGPFRDALVSHREVRLAAVNLGGSGAASREVTNEQVERAIDRLLTDRTL